MKASKRLLALLMAFVLLVSMAPAVFAADGAFDDVASDAWYAAPVQWAVENGITGGIGNGLFGPENTCTRAQVVTFLYAAAGKPEMDAADDPFTDVDTGDWYYNAVLWAVENGVTSGMTPTTFGPDSPCTRAQVATFLYAAEGKPSFTATKSPFSDVSSSDWFYAPVMWAVENDVTGGVGNGLFGYERPCNRAQIATFLYKSDQIRDDIMALTDLTVCLGSEPWTMDPALNSAADSAAMISHLFSGLAKWDVDASGNPVIVADAAEALTEPVVNADGTVTYTYTIRDMKWSDGVPVTAHDYEFAWKRAASEITGADYGYMFEVVKGYPNDLAVSALDDKTLQVTLNSRTSYWNELLAFGVYMPVREDVVSRGVWATNAASYVSNGLYTMTEWDHDSVIVLEKNEGHPDAAGVKVSTLRFALSDDGNEMLERYAAGDWLLIDTVPYDELGQILQTYGDEFMTVGTMGTYYFNWNVNKSLLPDDSTLSGADAERANAEIRKALSLLIDREAISDIAGGQKVASSFVGMGMTDADNSQFYENANSTEDDFVGYFDVNALAENRAAAVETLKKYYTYDDASGKFTDVPVIEYIYNTSEAHKAIAEVIQADLWKYGISVQLQDFEWGPFLDIRKEGAYTAARNGWIADYNDPITFLDMWTSGSGNNDVRFGMDAHGELAMYSLDLTPWGINYQVSDGTWTETYDVLIEAAKNCTDNEVYYEMMHLAEDMLMETGCVCPLYYYTDSYLIGSELSGVYVNPLGYKFFAYAELK